MKKILFALASVALLFATSCKKEQSINPAVDVPEGSFLATIDNGANPQNAPVVKDGMSTMTTIDGNRFVIWESGDQISINGSIYTTTSTPGSSAVFSGGNASGSKYHAFYPASIAGEGAAGVLPDTQTYVSGKVSNLPMYACSENNQLEFHNICAVLKIAVPSFVDGATRIEVSSDKAMHGTFTIGDNFAATVADATTDADKKLTVKKQSNAAFATNDTVYIAVPANEYGSLKVEFLDGTTSLWTKTVTNQTLVANKVYNINATPVGLCFTYVEQGQGKTNCTIKLSKNGSPNQITIDTCTYNASTKTYTDWGSYTTFGGDIVLNNVGDKVYFRAGQSENGTFYKDTYNYYRFSATDSVEVSGNIMTLLSQTPSTIFPTGSTYTFASLFFNMKTLKSAENLSLPATTLVPYCYSNMFSGCAGLPEAPALPATTLANACYSNMFYGCKGLTTAPTLPATTLAWKCYTYMFYNCKGLTTAPTLPATTLANACYFSMFYNCSGLTTAPTLPATTLKGNCYSYMFYGCTGLTAAPVLSATTLADSCYLKMFSGCTVLTAAPALPATTLAMRCYKYMFEKCYNLESVTMKAMNVDATECLSLWLDKAGTNATNTPTLTVVNDPSNAVTGWTNVTNTTNTPSNWTIKSENGTTITR